MEDFPDLGWMGDSGSKPVKPSRRLRPIAETLAMLALVVISTASSPERKTTATDDIGRLCDHGDPLAAPFMSQFLRQ